jgi:hypothetical protein
MPQQHKKTVSKNLLTVMRHRMSKLRKNNKEFKAVGRGGLSGAVGIVFVCCPKDRGFDTQLRSLVFAQKNWSQF